MDGAKSPVDLLYAAFQRAENKVGGGEGLVGIYGTMTQQGTDNVMRAMAALAGLDSRSTLVDIGAGLCRPLLHAVVRCNVQRTYGVELDAVKCQKAVPFVHHVVSHLSASGVKLHAGALPTIICASVEQLGSLEPATHAYAAWEGFPVQAKMAVGDLFSVTPSLHTITIVQRSLRCEDPAEVMADLGFGSVRLVAPAIPVSMAGSQRRLNAYVFSKAFPTACQGSQSRHAANETCISTHTRAHTSASSAAVPASTQHAVNAMDVWGSRCDAAASQQQQQQHLGNNSRGSGTGGRALPTLASAAPFHPAAVMEALARMGAEEGAAPSAADPGPTTKRVRYSLQDSGHTHNAHVDLGNRHEQQQQQQNSPAGRHSHGLRSHRQLSMRALEGLQGESDGSDEGRDAGQVQVGVQLGGSPVEQRPEGYGLRRQAQPSVRSQHSTERGEECCGSATAAAGCEGTQLGQQQQQQKEQQQRRLATRAAAPMLPSATDTEITLAHASKGRGGNERGGSQGAAAGVPTQTPSKAAPEPVGLQRVLRERKPRGSAPVNVLNKQSQLSSSRQTRSSVANTAGAHQLTALA